MSTKNPRINVTFEQKTAKFLTQLAREEDKSLASLVRELALEAIELREDLYLSKIAKKLDRSEVQTYGHDDAWK